MNKGLSSFALGVRKDLLIFVFAALLGSCAVGPDSPRNYHQPPKMNLGEGWSDTAVPNAAPITLSRWWESLGDPTLERLIVQALAENLDVQIAANRVAEARAIHDRISGAQIPSIAARSSVNQRRQSENGPLPIDQIPGLERDQTIYEAGFDAAWEIDLFGTTRRAVEAAAARTEAAAEQGDAIQLSVTAEVARTYISLRGAQQRLIARVAAVDSAMHARVLTAERFTAGDITAEQLSIVDTALAALQAQLPALENEVRAAALSIGVLLGDLPEAELGLIDDDGQQRISLHAIPVGERADVLRRRPDVRAAERLLAAATADIGVSRAQRFPQLSINASGGFQSLQTTNIFESASQVFSVVPLISWRVLDGGRVRAEIRASEIGAETAALEYERSVLLALSDAERALSRYRADREVLARRSTALAAARQSYGYAEARQRIGDTGLLPLLDREITLREAEDSEVQAYTRAATSLIALYKALGGGWRLDP